MILPVEMQWTWVFACADRLHIACVVADLLSCDVLRKVVCSLFGSGLVEVCVIGVAEFVTHEADDVVQRHEQNSADEVNATMIPLVVTVAEVSEGAGSRMGAVACNEVQPYGGASEAFPKTSHLDAVEVA